MVLDTVSRLWIEPDLISSDETENLSKNRYPLAQVRHTLRKHMHCLFHGEIVLILLAPTYHQGLFMPNPQRKIDHIQGRKFMHEDTKHEAHNDEVTTNKSSSVVPTTTTAAAAVTSSVAHLSCSSCYRSSSGSYNSNVIQPNSMTVFESSRPRKSSRSWPEFLATHPPILVRHLS